MGRKNAKARAALKKRKYNGTNRFGRYYPEGEQRVLDEGEIENFEVVKANESKLDLSTNGV